MWPDSAGHQRTLHMARLHQSPIETIQEHRELRCTQPDQPFRWRRPKKTAGFKAFVMQPHAAERYGSTAFSVRHQNLHPVSALRTEDEGIARKRVFLEDRLDQGAQTRQAFSEIYGLRGHQNAGMGRRRDHRPNREPSTRRSADALTSRSIRTWRPSPRSISIRPRRVVVEGGAMPDLPSSTTEIGTKAGPR